MQSPSPSREVASEKSESYDFRIGQRVHSAGDCRRIGTVEYVGPVQGHSGNWVGVDWDNSGGKHDGCVSGVRYFHAKSDKSASFVRPQNLSPGITVLQALEVRYKSSSTKEEEDEMYVLSASNRRVSVQFLGKDKIQDKLSRFEELTGASLSFLGIGSSGHPSQISATMPNLKELDLTGNLLSEWRDVGSICEGLPTLAAINLSNNLMSHEIVGLPQLNNIRILVLNNTGISWIQVEILKLSLPTIEELHLMGNKLSTITTSSSISVQGFDFLKLLNLEDNCITDWNEVLRLSQLRSLEQLYLNKNSLNHVWYPDCDLIHDASSACQSVDKSNRPFQNLRCLLLGGNNISDLASVDSLNDFPSLMDTRLSENPIADPGKGGLPRFVLVARLSKVKMLNGSEVTSRERKDSEIRYVRLVMSKLHNQPEEITKLHPRFHELKAFHGIDDENPTAGAAGPQKMAAGLMSVTLKCVGHQLVKSFR
ncbi:hypothetical protein NMG60_11015126 [Bertholletia excelsa]